MNIIDTITRWFGRKNAPTPATAPAPASADISSELQDDIDKLDAALGAYLLAGKRARALKMRAACEETTDSPAPEHRAARRAVLAAVGKPLDIGWAGLEEGRSIDELAELALAFAQRSFRDAKHGPEAIDAAQDRVDTALDLLAALQALQRAVGKLEDTSAVRMRVIALLARNGLQMTGGYAPLAQPAAPAPVYGALA